MNTRKIAIATAAAAALGFASAAHAWTGSFNDLVNGVSGTLTDTGFSGGAEHYTLVLNIGSSGAAIGSRMTAVDIKAWDGSSYGSFTFGASAGTWVNPPGDGGISAGPNGGPQAGPDGCNTGSGGFACIQANPTFQNPLIIAANSTYTFNFDVVGAAFDTDGTGSHVGVGFTQFDGTGNVGIVSENTVSAIPEPETYAMLLAGLGLMGFVARRRKKALV